MSMNTLVSPVTLSADPCVLGFGAIFIPAFTQAGGASSGDGLCKSALDIDINAYDQRTEVCFGSTGEVRRFEEYLYGEWLDRSGV